MNKNKKKKYCEVCGLPGSTKCAPQANCLSKPLEAEQKAKSKKL